jgi:hypothetical protein
LLVFGFFGQEVFLPLSPPEKRCNHSSITKKNQRKTILKLGGKKNVKLEL